MLENVQNWRLMVVSMEIASLDLSVNGTKY